MRFCLVPLILATVLLCGPQALAQEPRPPDPAQTMPASDPAPARSDAAPAQAAPAPQTAPVPPPVMPPAPAPPADPLAGILGPEVKMFGYGIRPPKDSTYSVVTRPETLETIFTWRGAVHQDGTITLFVAQILHYTPRRGVKDPRDFEMREVLKGIQDLMGNFQTAPVQNGTVGGFPALRTTMAGTMHRRTGGTIAAQGFLYVVQDGQLVVAIMGLDSAGFFTANFPALNAAALSFHK